MIGERISNFIAKFWTHIFVIATGFAALTHSTWTLATAFGGSEPLAFSHDWWPWLIPGLLIAFSFDIGQIAISVELRNGERTKPKYVAFLVLAISTYFLQWWYLAHHLPSLALAEGLRPEWRWFAELLSDAIVWVAPGLLPLATTLYTFSYAKPPKQRTAPPSLRSNARSMTSEFPANRAPTIEQKVEPPQIAGPSVPALPEPAEMTAVYLAECPRCGWTKACTNERSKINSLNAHKVHCPANVEAK